MSKDSYLIEDALTGSCDGYYRKDSAHLVKAQLKRMFPNRTFLVFRAREPLVEIPNTVMMNRQDWYWHERQN